MWEAVEKSKLYAYEEDLQDAEDEYKEAMDAFNNQNVGLKILEKKLNGKRTEPTKRIVKKPNIKDVPDKTYLGSFIKLDGYSMGDDDAVTVKISLQETNSGTPRELTKTTVNGTTYRHYEVYLRQIVNYQMIGADGSVIYTEVVKATERTKKVSSKVCQVGPEWDKYKEEKWDSYYNTEKEKFLKGIMKQTNDAINFRFGYSHVKRLAIVYSGVAKKFNYDNHVLASKKSQRAYENLILDKEAAVEKLTQAIGIWEKELQESNLSNKKARINSVISQALYCNMASAYISLGDYKKAEEYLDKIDIMDGVKKKYANRAENLRDFLRDEKKRNS